MYEAESCGQTRRSGRQDRCGHAQEGLKGGEVEAMLSEPTACAVGDFWAAVTFM